MNSYERIKLTYEHKEADRVPIVDTPWAGTMRRWINEGLPKDTDWRDYFGTDKVADIYIDISPRFEEKVIEDFEEDEVQEPVVAPVAEEDKESIEEEPVVAPVKTAKEEQNKEVEELKAQLEELNRQLAEARQTKVEVVSIDMTEEECIARLETLEERLKVAKKDYKINMKEYRPLKKVMTDLEKYQTKLRRKETIVAKKKVALYGVNNYVDIDKEKAEKLANELELLDGLRLSVSHCEEVINANKDRFPILEHSNQILENQIATLEADIASTQATLQRIRDKKGGNK